MKGVVLRKWLAEEHRGLLPSRRECPPPFHKHAPDSRESRGADVLEEAKASCEDMATKSRAREERHMGSTRGRPGAFQRRTS